MSINTEGSLISNQGERRMMQLYKVRNTDKEYKCQFGSNDMNNAED